MRLSIKPYIPLLCLSAAFYFTVKEQKDYFYKNSPDQVTQNMYGTHYFTVKRDLALELPQHISDKNKPICVFGHEPEIFYYAHLRSASGFLYLYPALESQPYAQQMADKFIHETEAADPEILIYLYDTVPSQNPVTSEYLKKWIDNYKKNYRIIGQVYVENGSPKIEWQSDTSKVFLPKNPYYALVYRKK